MLEAIAKPNVNKMNLLDVVGHAGVWRAQGKSFVESVFLVPWLTPSLVAPFASEFLDVSPAPHFLRQVHFDRFSEGG